MKCFLYARKSTDEPDRQLLSIEAQLAELREFAHKESIRIVKMFTESRTAKKPGRPVFNEMMNLIEAGKAQGILSWHPDRLARNSVDGGRIIYALDTGNLKALKFPTFWFEPTPQGKFMLNIAFGQSKYYVDNLSENIRRGIRQKLRRGEFPGKPPVGYTNEPRLRTIVVHERKAPLVRKMFEAYATGRYSLKQLRDLIVSWGLLSTQGNRPAISKLPKTLSNPFYRGSFRYNDELYEGSHELFISQELFHRVQVVLKERGRVKSRHVEIFPYLGLMRCGECGCAITAERQKTYHYYRCTRKKGPCSLRFAREEVITNQLRQSMGMIALPDDWFPQMRDQIEKWESEDSSCSSTILCDCQTEMVETTKMLSRLTDLLVDGSLSREEYLPRKEALLQHKMKLSDRIADMEAESDNRYRRLELFLQEAEDADGIAVTDNLDDLKSFHRRTGSNFFLCGPEKISRTGFLSRHPAATDGHNGTQSDSSPEGRTNTFFGGKAAAARAKQVTQSPETLRVSGEKVAVSESLRDWIQIPFDANTGHANTVSETGKRVRKIRQEGLPVLCVKFTGPWKILASFHPEGQISRNREIWWSFLNRARTFFDNASHLRSDVEHAPDGASDS